NLPDDLFHDRIVARVAAHPLALNVARCMMLEAQISSSRFLELLESGAFLEVAQAGGYAREFATIGAAYDQLDEDSRAVFLVSSLRSDGTCDTEFASAVLKTPVRRVQIAMLTLSRYGLLLSSAAYPMFSMHTLVSEFGRSVLERNSVA